jgi:dipeptidyl aminopeptidase/acylaminoacyl peptidase
LKRESATESPNLVVTTDFKNFIPITSLNPEKRYNWLTSELVRWTTFDGQPGLGILYKPENFDLNKKYPVIFYFYDRLSDGLNSFIKPELCTGSINIPYYVSQGYLIFCPDIYYKLGKTEESVYNYVASAAQILARKSWVNAKRMGIQGHSFGGYEVNSLVTKTGIFAAACSAAGSSDLVSDYDEWADGNSFSFGQSRMPASPWDRNAYVNNSPIYSVKNVTTPLLMMHNKSDVQVPWLQSVELFCALRRLDKAAWMLQYDEQGNGHVLWDKKNKLDYTIRMKQFFDHYLKDAPAPTWMTQGIPAKLKQIESGYSYDPVGNCGKDCKVCKYWNEKFKKDSAACWKEIEDKTRSEHWMASGEAGGH